MHFPHFSQAHILLGIRSFTCLTFKSLTNHDYRDSFFFFFFLIWIAYRLYLYFLWYRNIFVVTRLCRQIAKSRCSPFSYIFYMMFFLLPWLLSVYFSQFIASKNIQRWSLNGREVVRSIWRWRNLVCVKETVAYFFARSKRSSSSTFFQVAKVHLP